MRVKINKSEFLNVLSLGAGRQSSYLLIKSLENKILPRVDYAVFADTGNEPSYIYSFLARLQESVWERFRFEINVIKSSDIVEDTVQFCAGLKKSNNSPPFFLSQGGLLRRHCTLHYKIRPVRKFIRSVMDGHPVKLMIGISLDEMERMSVSDVKYIQHVYPLVDSRIRISQILHEFSSFNIGLPAKSSCKICPYHSDIYWYQFKRQFPAEFFEICNFDNSIRNFPSVHSRAYLHKSLIPLGEINFSQPASLFPELIEECSGFCGL